MITLNAVIGFPLKQSLSPAFHNPAYKKLGLNAVMLPLELENVKDCIHIIKKLPLCLTAVTMPHKQTIMPFLDTIDAAARKIGAVNTVINHKGKLYGFNTDVVGIAKALENVPIKNKNILLIGAGGAARPAAYYIHKNKGKLFCFNRTFSHAEALSREFGGRPIQIIENGRDRSLQFEKFDLIINATPLGMAPWLDQSPIEAKFLRPGQVVFDFVYNPRETKLLKAAKKAGAKTISGWKMFIAQAQEQIKLYRRICKT